MKLQIDKILYIPFYEIDFYKQFILKGSRYGGLESDWCNRLTIIKR